MLFWVLYCIIFTDKTLKKKKKAINIWNPFVIALPIGVYKEYPTTEDEKNIGGWVEDYNIYFVIYFLMFFCDYFCCIVYIEMYLFFVCM